MKYLTWGRTVSSRSASSRNLLGVNSVDDGEDVANNLFDNFCMVSGSHASTLDRLYVWEKKLYDEVKVCSGFECAHSTLIIIKSIKIISLKCGENYFLVV